jgi:hypothetical protein
MKRLRVGIRQGLMAPRYTTERSSNEHAAQTICRSAKFLSQHLRLTSLPVAPINACRWYINKLSSVPKGAVFVLDEVSGGGSSSIRLCCCIRKGPEGIRNLSRLHRCFYLGGASAVQVLSSALMTGSYTHIYNCWAGLGWAKLWSHAGTKYN